MAEPAWVSRLRSASFESPNGVVSDFKVDIVSRTGGKKASNHEILNRDISIVQEQGNKSIVYPIDAYFTGEDGDREADAFFKSLGEKYTVDTPGILRHPRWGDISVMPFSFQQTENLVTEGGIFRVIVEFRPIPLSNFPTPDGINESEITADANELENTIEEANATIDDDDSTDYNTLSNRIKRLVVAVDSALGSIVETVQEEFDQIKDGIYTALEEFQSIVDVVDQVSSLIRLGTDIYDDTLDKVNAYTQMTYGLVEEFEGYFDTATDIMDKINNALLFQSVTATAAAATAEAAMYTDLETRDAVGVAIDAISEVESLANEGTLEIYQTIADGNNSGIVSNRFAPDHNVSSSLGILTSKAISVLLSRSFDLKSKLTVVLTGPSDPITMTWKLYGDLDKLDFFILTNNIKDKEFYEIPSGREIIAYV